MTSDIRSKILIVAATDLELQSFKNDPVFACTYSIKTLVTGVGATLCLFSLTRLLENEKFSYAFQIGIAGSYQSVYAPGSGVVVKQDCFADTGAEDASGEIINFFENGLIPANNFPFEQGVLPNNHQNLLDKITVPVVDGITVNTSSGTAATIQRRKKLNADIESMEGAAFHYAMRFYNIPFLQIRGISNFVELRNRENWKVNEALNAVSQILGTIINRL